MEPRKTLDKINSEDHVNEIISRDEENPVKGSSPALQMAEELILQLPAGHEGRNRWLKTYGQSEEARNLQEKKQKPV
jgi:hypothetical protein